MKATLFKEVGWFLSALIDNIDMGIIGLPDIQRPFVWKAAKVRDLFDSMYKGFPVGYLRLFVIPKKRFFVTYLQYRFYCGSVVAKKDYEAAWTEF